tara:strand:- start:1591 stop:2160 length:570 start_codon:yes stop_codon:yes gene_type:complete
MSSKPILFYSKKDSNSINLWNKLNSKNKLDEFVKICVDNNNKIPQIVTSVPSIYIKGRPLIQGSAINMFLDSNNSVISRQVNTMPNNASVSKTNSQPMQPTNSNDINSFNPVEMSERWSDSYSFIEENPEPMNYCYQFINEGNKNIPAANTNIVTGTGNQINTRKANNQLDSRLEKLQMERGMMNRNFN